MSKDDTLRCSTILQYLTLSAQIHTVLFLAVLRIGIPLDPGSGIGFFHIQDPKPIFLRA
jgi:hypothetical protein